MGQCETDPGSATRRDHVGNFAPVRRFIPPQTETFTRETCADNAIAGRHRQRDRLSPLQMGCQGAVDIQCKWACPTNRADVARKDYLSGSTVPNPIEGENPLGRHRLRLFGADLAGCTAGENDARHQAHHDLLHDIPCWLKLTCPVQRRKQPTSAMVMTPTGRYMPAVPSDASAGVGPRQHSPKRKAPTKAGAFHYNWCRKQESNLRPTHYECGNTCLPSIT